MDSRPIVLLIHGMGTHKPGNVTKEFKDGLEECATFLGISSINLEKEFEFQEFNYSDYIDKKRAKFGDEAKAITELLSAGPLFLQRLVSFQMKLKENEFLYTHWLDVIFYCLLGTLRETIISKCMVKIMTVLKAAKDDPNNLRQVIIVGHSLGTALLHDTLTNLYLRPNQPDKPDHIKFSNYSIEGLWTIANVSRLTHILTKLENPETSMVRDNNAENDGVSYFFYPVYNQFDPFTIFKRYAVDPQAGDLIRTNEIRKINDPDIPVNPHSLTEYLADPEVGGVFLSEFSTYDISVSQIQKAKKLYRETTISGPISDNLTAVKEAMRELEKQFTSGNSIKLVTTTMELFELVKDFYNILKSEDGKKIGRNHE